MKDISTMPQITVAIPTYNRGEILQYVCEALLWQSVSPDKFCVLIVDNNSTDDTPHRMAAMEKLFPHFSYIVEKKAGSSHARNTAWQNCTTPWIAYLDDDARPFPHYVESLIKAISQHRCDVIAGKVIPWKLQSLPIWFRDEYETYAPIPNPDGYLSAKDFAIGGNMALRCDKIQQAGGFDPRFGVRGTLIPYGEETVLQIKMRQMGARILYVPEATVAHLAKASRYSVQNLLHISYFSGKSTPIVYDWRGAYQFFRLCCKIPYRLTKAFITNMHMLIFGRYRWQNVIIGVGGECMHLIGMFVGFFWLQKK